MLTTNLFFVHPSFVQKKAQFFFFFLLIEHNHTLSGKKTGTGEQVITTSRVQSIGCRWQPISSSP